METKIVWREYFSDDAVRQLTEMGTLPRYETAVYVCDITTGDDVATRLAELAHEQDNECFQADGEKLVILEPEEFAGTYEVLVYWEASFSANRCEEATT